MQGGQSSWTGVRARSNRNLGEGSGSGRKAVRGYVVFDGYLA